MDETSAIARKLQNFPVDEDIKYFEQKHEPGIFKNVLLICLMASAVFLTHITLILVKWTKQLEDS